MQQDTDPLPVSGWYSDETKVFSSMLEALSENKVFSVRAEEDGTFRFTEECDDYFFLTLNREHVRKLANELLTLIGANGDERRHVICLCPDCTRSER